MYSKIRTHHRHPTGKVFARMAMIVSLSLAMVATVLPNFVEQIIGNEVRVGYFYSAMAIVLFIAKTLSGALFQRFSKIKIFYILSLILLVATGGLLLVWDPTTLIGVEYLRAVVAVSITMCIMMLIRDFANKSELGKAEGAFFAFSNIGWLIGPIVAGLVIHQYGVNAVFWLATGVCVVLIAYFTHQHMIEKNPELIHNSEESNQSNNLFKNFLSFFASRERNISYLITFTIVAWWEFIYIYIPLYIINQGFEENMIGWFLAGIVVPIIVFEQFAGAMSDRIGIKTPTIWGLVFMALTAFIGFGFFESTYVVLSILILSSIGAAFVEPLQDIYFFRTASLTEENKFFGVLKTASSSARFIIPMISSAIIAWLAFEYIFIMIGALMLISATTIYYFAPKNSNI